MNDFLAQYKYSNSNRELSNIAVTCHGCRSVQMPYCVFHRDYLALFRIPLAAQFYVLQRRLVPSWSPSLPLTPSFSPLSPPHPLTSYSLTPHSLTTTPLTPSPLTPHPSFPNHHTPHSLTPHHTTPHFPHSLTPHPLTTTPLTPSLPHPSLSSQTRSSISAECSQVCVFEGHRDGVWEVAHARNGMPLIGTASAGV